MNTFLKKGITSILQVGTKAAKLCGAGLRFATAPVVSLALRAMRKGNRAATKLVHGARRFIYIARRYGYKRAVRLTAYRCEQLFQGYGPRFKRGMVRFVPMALAAVVLVISLNCWTAFTLAYEVNYNGSNVGYVASESVFEDACQLVGDRVVEEEFTADAPTYTLKVVAADTVNDADELCENIIEASDEICSGVGLYVDHELIAVCDNGAAIQSAMEQVVTDYAQNNGDEKVSFANEIEYINGVYPSHLIKKTVASQELAEVLTVMMTTTETYTEVIPFETKEIRSASQYIGYRYVRTKGVDGKRKVTADVSYVNGKEVGRSVVSQEVLKEAVTCEVVVGTKPYSGASNTNTGTPLFWPVANTDTSNISSYFGDGRNHKGTDILAPNGTPIYAAEDGVVTYVGWESGYGYYCVIDHGDGVSTLYSHCSSITAKQGQTVSRGDYIAAVGITGRATAYHLHFEVRIHGSAVDARPYLGIR